MSCLGWARPAGKPTNWTRTGVRAASASPTPVKCGEVHRVLVAVTLATLGITAVRTRQTRLAVSCRSLIWFPCVHGSNPGIRRGSSSPFPGNIAEGARGQAVGVAHVSFGIRRGSRVPPRTRVQAQFPSINYHLFHKRD